MSTKINALIPAAAAAAGIPIPTISPVAEPLLSTLAVTAIYCAEIQDGSGKFMMFATIGADTRAVAGTDGNVKLYSNSLAALRAAKIANLAGKLEFSIYEKIPTTSNANIKSISRSISKSVSIKTPNISETQKQEIILKYREFKNSK